MMQTDEVDALSRLRHYVRNGDVGGVMECVKYVRGRIGCSLLKLACRLGDIEMVALLWALCPPNSSTQSRCLLDAYKHGHAWLGRMMIETLHVEGWSTVWFPSGEIWRLWKTGKVARRVFAQNCTNYEKMIKEGEAEAACAKATLLESTTLPEAVIQYIVNLF